MTHPGRRASVLFATVPLLMSACGLLPGGGNKPAEMFDELIAAAGNSPLVDFEASRIQGNWYLKITTNMPDNTQMVWSRHTDEVTSKVEDMELVAPAKQLTTERFQQLFDQINARAPKDCDTPVLEWQVAPNGSELTWVECDIQNNYVYGTARIDGQPVQDSYDITNPADLDTALALFARILPDGKATYLAFSPGPDGISFIAHGTQLTMLDGKTCWPGFGVHDQPLYAPGTSGCTTDWDGTGAQPFDPTTFAGADLAPIPDAIAEKAGVPKERISSIKLTSPDGINLTGQTLTGFQQYTFTVHPR